MARKQQNPQMSPQEFGDAMNGLAQVLDVPTRQLRLGVLRCIAKQIGWLKLFQCLGQGDNWLACVGDAVDFAGVLDCVMEQFGAGGFAKDEF